MKYFTIVFLFLFAQLSIAQSITEVVRYTNQQTPGTARTAGVAGAFGAMGGDFGSVNINPAGLGTFYKSQFNFGLSLNNVKNDAFLVRDNESIDRVNDLNLNINNISYLIHNRPSGSLLTSNFIIGVSQLNNFSEEFSYDGNTIGSITERFAEVANGNELNQLDAFEAGVAYDAGAIYDINDDLFYETDFFDTTNVISKNQYLDRKGSMNEFTFGWGGNIDRVINFGVTASMPFISFEEYKEYTETDPTDALPVFTNLEYKENLSTSGYGFNVKAGISASIAKFLRLGVAYHSPNWLTMTDDYSTEMVYTFNDENLQTFTSDSGDGSFKYKLVTPGKLIFSAGVLFDLGDVKGFVNGDFQIQNYSNANFDFQAFSGGGDFSSYEDEQNKDIVGELASAKSVRIGTEWVYKKFRVRAGINGEGSPYKIDNSALVRTTVAGGIGFRGDKFYIDMTAFQYSDSEGYYPYLVLTNGRNQLVNKDQNTLKAMVTIGFMID